MRRVVPFLVLSLAVVVGATSLLMADDKPKYSIKEAMKFHKEKLHEKFTKGEASKEDKQKLLEAYESMLKVKPPKGDEKDWKEKCEALVKAVKDDDKDGLKKAVNCGGCHSAHKG